MFLHKSWNMIVGGSMSGKTTLAMKCAENESIVSFMSHDQKATQDTLNAMSEVLDPNETKDVYTLYYNGDFKRIAEGEIKQSGMLIIDEIQPREDESELLMRGIRCWDRVVWAAYPTEWLAGNDFYLTCKHMGTVRTLMMRPEFVEKVGPEEILKWPDWRQRVFGLMPN